MNSIKQYLVLTALLVVAVACSEKELDLYPETRLSVGAFYTNETQLVQATNDVYRQLSRLYDANGIPSLYGELYSDNVTIQAAGGANSFAEDITQRLTRPDNGRLQTAWESAYNGIYICNNALDQLAATSVTFSQPGLKERLQAEALFVRSLIYFNLVRAFGGVPMPLRVVAPAESYQYIRETPDVVYAQIIKDLLASKAALPASYTGANVGRVTKYGASAVLAEVYATRGDKTNATKEAKEIIDSGLYSLDANRDGVANTLDYRHLFLADTKNSRESILEAQYLAGQNQVNSIHQNAYTPFIFSFHLPGSTETFRGEGLNTPLPDLINEYEPADPRKDLSLALGFTDLQSKQFIPYPYTLKFYDPLWRYPGQNVEIIRYADILLLYAELTNDAAYLNQVRVRVGLAAYGSAGYPAAYNTLARAIEHERRVELAFEFHRFFDLVRTGRALEVLQSKGYPNAPNKLLFPIPQTTIDTNPAITQNPL